MLISALVVIASGDCPCLQVWVKPREVLTRDRLLGVHEVSASHTLVVPEEQLVYSDV